MKNLHFLRFQLNNIENAYAKFCEYQEQIFAIALTADEQAKHERCEMEFEALRRGLTLRLNETIEKLEKPAPTAALVSAAPANGTAPLNLPPLSVPLPKFDGSFETWYSFKSMFQNIMARYTNEAPAIKLYHLRDALVGKAAGVIDRDIVNNNDYDAAWAILEEMFEDKRAIIDRHIKNIFELPKITRDNPAELRKLIETCGKNIEGLKSLQLPVNGLGEQMLVNLLASRMDVDTQRAWEAEQKIGVLPTYAGTIVFLKERCRVLERVEAYGASSAKPSRSVALVIATETKCSMCNQQQHQLKNCELLSGASVNEKYRHLRKHGLCFNCLQKGHRVGECTSTNSCHRCSKRHHTTLHTAGTNQQTTTTKKEPRTSRDEPKKHAMLPTAVVQVYGEDGMPHLCRTLIDSCSQNHFVSERFADLLAVQKKRADCSVSGLNGETTRVSHLVRATIKSRVSNFATDLELLVVPRITGDTPVKTINIAGWNLPSDLELADPNFNRRGPVDMLLGAELFWNLIKAGKMKLADDLLSLRETEHR